MNREIVEYLKQENPDFVSGFDLFCRYSRNESLMSWIGRKRDVAMLRYELKKLADLPPVENPFAETQKVRYSRIPGMQISEKPSVSAPSTGLDTGFKVYDDRRLKRSDLPDDLREIYDRTVEEYHVRRGYHEKMKSARTDEDRAEFRKKILETEERIRSGFAVIDARLEEAEKQKVEEAFNEKSARAYISKALKKETVSDKVASGVKIRVQALLDNGCTIGDELRKELEKRHLFNVS